MYSLRQLKTLRVTVILCLFLPISVYSQVEVGCDMTQNVVLAGPPCSDPWTYYSQTAFVEVQSVPPCSVEVIYAGIKRCGYVIIHDYAFRTIPVVSSPPGCLSPSQLHSLMDSTLTDSVMSQAARIVGAAIISQTPSIVPPCPNEAKIVVGSWTNCRRLVLTYTLPNGQTVAMPYDITRPWSYYELLITAQGGTNGMVSSEDCKASGCCYQELFACRETNGNIRYRVGPWIQTGGLCEYQYDSQNDCNYRMCGE